MTSPEPPTERIVFSGRVQGVGFRYQTHTLARRYPVNGFVRNQSDGTVELVVQGEVAAINALLADIAHHFRGNISHTDRQTVEGEFSNFEIRS